MFVRWYDKVGNSGFVLFNAIVGIIFVQPHICPNVLFEQNPFRCMRQLFPIVIAT